MVERRRSLLLRLLLFSGLIGLNGPSKASAQIRFPPLLLQISPSSSIFTSRFRPLCFPFLNLPFIPLGDYYEKKQFTFASIRPRR